jgi:hypothetical protein
LSKVTCSVAYARLADRPVRYAAGSVEARKADLLRRTIGSLVDTVTGAGVRYLTLPPSQQVPDLLPGKIISQEWRLRHLKDASAASALDGDLCAATERPVRGGRPADLARAITRVRDGGDRLRRVRGNRPVHRGRWERAEHPSGS